MVLYFTATGNSRWVAEQIAEATNDETLNMVDCLKRDEVPDLSVVTERVGIVFPVHSWYVPRPLVAFLSKLRIPTTAYRYAVCTCGDDAGKTMNRLSSHYPLDAAWSVAMPNTYIPMFELDSDTVSLEKVAAARVRLRRIAVDIMARRRTWDVCEGSFPWLKTYLINPLFVRFTIRTKGFRVDDGCISCGSCVKSCPLSNISLSGGRPVWGKQCMHCMACIHACPERVIQYGKSTRMKGRYKLARFLSQ